MKLYHFICVSVLLILIVFVPLSADAGLIWGPSARTLFEEHRDRNLDMFTDFEGTPTGIYNLLPVKIPSDNIKLARLLFELDTTEFRYPLPVRPAPAGTKVAVCPYDYVKTPPNHRLLGLTVGNIPDGQSKYEIKFQKCLDHVGLKRMFNTNSVTRFYQQNRLLAEHRNTENVEFVGYIVEKDNPYDDCVTRVEFDGHPLQPDDEDNKLYMVGPVDDLFYSVPALLVGVLTNGSSDSVVSAGDEVNVNIGWRNYGSYSMKFDLTVEFFNHEKNKTDRWTKSLSLNARDQSWHNFTIKTLEDTTVGYYKVKASVRSSAGVLVDEMTNWYFVKTKSLVSPSINSLLLRDK